MQVSANSVYGFTGLKVEQLPVTSVSDQSPEVIADMKKRIEMEFDGKVVHSDTDSVFVQM